jgi:dTDP-4-amino-4,6-dideoxygalactose transaminase
MIPFNKPYITGKEVHHIYGAVATGHISGNGKYTKLCQKYFQDRFGFKKALLTTSCTDALEMCAMLLNIEPGDEVILPSFTFVSTALAFTRQGAVLKFADSCSAHPGMDSAKIEELITAKTKAIAVVHYAGVACDMDAIMSIASKHNIFVVEDAAQAIDSYYTGADGIKKPLGSIGHLGCFSFHETKNIQCGEGGLLAINHKPFVERAEIIWEKGTNRAQFFRGEINKYGWVDTGSSFLPSEINAAFLWAQLEELDIIQKKRCNIWHSYNTGLESWASINSVKMPFIPANATCNAHMFYMVCPSVEFRTELISHLKAAGVHSVFHYQSLHCSDYYAEKHGSRPLPMSDIYTDRLIRLPLFAELDETDFIIKKCKEFSLVR